MSNRFHLPAVLSGILILIAGASPGAHAQESDPHDELDSHIRFKAEYQLEKGSRRGVILVTADIAGGNHIYALKQPGSMPPSKITVAESPGFHVTRKFVPDRKPVIVDPDPIYGSLARHRGKVVFWAPLELKDDTDGRQLEVELRFSGAVCTPEDLCFPIRKRKIEVSFAGFYEPKRGKK